MSLVPLMLGVDRTSDVKHKLHFVHLGGLRCMIVAGRAGPSLCDDHSDPRRWRSREDGESPRKITLRELKGSGCTLLALYWYTEGSSQRYTRYEADTEPCMQGEL